MSTINRIRFVNINYNNGSNRIGDETFNLNGESTLMSLANGGGKSVMVQLITSLFVHPKYRSRKNRPFQSYFTGRDPSFILIEWKLDGGAGYVLCGMMVRKNQDPETVDARPLDVIQFISEYSRPCLRDIQNIEIIDHSKKAAVVKGFGECRRLFQQYRQDSQGQFYTFVMPDQAKNYFDMLGEYRIYYREWESIIRVINQEEAGLTNLFKDCQDEQGLLKKWFLPAIEKKINVNGSRIETFQKLTAKYVGSYYKNRERYERRGVLEEMQNALAPVKDAAEKAMEAEDKMKLSQGRLGALFVSVEDLEKEAGEELEETDEELEEVREAIISLTLEQLSGEYYEMEDELHEHEEAKRQEEDHQKEIREQQEKTQKALNYLDLTQLQTARDEEVKSQIQAREELAAGKEKEKDTGEERAVLCRVLGALSGIRREENEKKIGDVQARREALKRQRTEVRQQIRAAADKIGELRAKEGSLGAKLDSYTGEEDRFNRKYAEKYKRSPLGIYAPGFDRDRMAALEKSCRQLEKQKDAGEKQIAAVARDLDAARADLDALTGEKIKTQRDLFNASRKKNDLDEQRQERSVICQHLGIKEDGIFDKDNIVRVAEERAKNVDARRIQKDTERRALLKEKEKLASGRPLELDPAIEKEFHDLGVSYVQGMEWMKKNGMSEEENRELARIHPFLPYSLILEEADIKKIEEHQGGHYTSSPIPMIERGALTQKEEEKVSSSVHFYLLFNGDLLNEEKVAKMIQEKEKAAGKCAEAVRTLGEEYQTYSQWIRTIQGQTLTKDGWNAAAKKVQDLEKRAEDEEKREARTKKDIEELEKKAADAAKEQKKTEDALALANRKKEDAADLFAAYAEYLSNRKTISDVKIEIKKQEKAKTLAESSQAKLIQEDTRLQLTLQSLDTEGKALEAEEAKYASEKENITDEDRKEASGLSAEDEEAKKARYTALTEGISATLRELERRLKEADRRVDRADDALRARQRKFGISQEEWDEVKGTVVYAEEEEERLQEEKKSEDNALLESVKRHTKEESLVTSIAANMERQVAKIKAETNEEEPIDRSLIEEKDFAAEIEKKNSDVKQLDEQRKEIENRQRVYETVRIGLQEFSDFEPLEEPGFEKAPEEMTPDELTRFQGTEIKQYRRAYTAREEMTGRMQEEIRQILSRPDFSDPYYHQRLEGLSQIRESGRAVYRQTDLLIESIGTLIEKFRVDLELVEKEKKSLEDQLVDYVREIHEGLQEIDRQAQITVHGKPVKMLQIQTDDWEKNEPQYETNLQAFMEELTQDGMKYLEAGEPSDDYYSRMITTSELYDRVVHIGTVRITLYKVEQQSGRRISWSEVARNSGGEGFLSAFVILESLLDYMRRDKTDIVGSRKESKVLVMDNPFGTTNAAHLLQPMMEMARKTETQLICFTGIGGDSVYSIFDNIYAMSLVGSQINSGVTYLQKNHVRGDEPSELLAERIQVADDGAMEDLF